MKHTKTFWISLLVFILLNIALYCGMYFFHARLSFQRKNYQNNFHHFLTDPRIQGKHFEFLPALAQADAQWYMKIAVKGYPMHPKNINIGDKKTMDGLTYAFFPLYPMTLSVFNILFHNIELTAFVLVNILLLLNFYSLYYVLTRQFSESVAVKSIFLLFVFPFSIFYRSYFTEGLMLLLLIWTGWFLMQKKWVYASVLMGLLNVLKSNALLLGLYVVYIFFNQYRKKKIYWRSAVLSVVFLVLPFVLWTLFCWYQTGDPFYFLAVRRGWYPLRFPLITLMYNLAMGIVWIALPIHGFHYSKIDTLMIYLVLFLLIKSRKTLPAPLWYMSFALWLLPILTTDSMSFTRYQIVSYPLFVYVSQHLSRSYLYLGMLLLSLIGLFFISLFFVNWYWIG